MLLRSELRQAVDDVMLNKETQMNGHDITWAKITDWRAVQQGSSHVDATVTLKPRHGTQRSD
jgi:hypothetical protein